MNKFGLILVLLLLICCGTVFGLDKSSRIIYDMPDDVAIKQFGAVSGAGLSAEDIAQITSENFTGDTLKLLAIMVHWSNRLGTYSQPTFDSMIFSDGVYPNGSVADYFKEVSYGKITVIGDVIDWYDAGNYNSNFDFESILPALDAFVDFSQYDGDNNGVVDAVTFIRSGTGEEDSGDPADIWSYAYSYGLGGGPGPFDGMMVSRWNTAPELRPLRFPVFPMVFSGVDSLNRIRVFVHELTHNLGLPDLYDYDDKLDELTYTTPGDFNDHPVYDWCVMGYAGYGLFSLRSAIPSHLCGWSKKQLGWVDPISLQGEFTDLVIKDIETHDDSSLYMVPIDPAEGEYFLLEYRNSQSTGTFDKVDSDFSVYFWPDLAFGGEPLDRGLLITHIHDSVSDNGWRINNGTPDYPNYTVTVEDAGYNPLMDYTMNPEGRITDSVDWWYPYETRKSATFQNTVPGQNYFGPQSTPNSDGYGGPSDIEVRVDSIVGDRLYMYVNNPNNFDIDGDGILSSLDNCPDIANPLQEDFDSDGIGDVCDACTDTDGDGFGNPGFPANSCGLDNCPDIANPLQEDIDNDNIGDVCDNCCIGFRGNTNNSADGEIDIADLIFLVSYAFQGGNAPECIEEGDINGSGGDNPIDISDIIMLVQYMFQGGDQPADCP